MTVTDRLVHLFPGCVGVTRTGVVHHPFFAQDFPLDPVVTTRMDGRVGRRSGVAIIGVEGEDPVRRRGRLGV